MLLCLLVGSLLSGLGSLSVASRQRPDPNSLFLCPPHPSRSVIRQSPTAISLGHLLPCCCVLGCPGGQVLWVKVILRLCVKGGCGGDRPQAFCPQRTVAWQEKTASLRALGLKRAQATRAAVRASPGTDAVCTQLLQWPAREAPSLHPVSFRKLFPALASPCELLCLSAFGDSLLVHLQAFLSRFCCCRCPERFSPPWLVSQNHAHSCIE